MSAFDLQLDCLLLERILPQKQPPGNEKHYIHIRNHYLHPVSECHVKMERIIEVSESDGIRRRPDRGSYSAYVSRYRYGEGKGDTAFAVRRQGLQHGSQERKHHGSRSRVAHEHRERAYHDQKTQKHEFRLLAERFEEDPRKLHVKSVFGGCYGKHETSEEKHDHRVGKSSQQRLVAYQCAEFVRNTCSFQKRQTAVGYGKQHDHYYQDGCRPGRNDLEHPHQRRKDEYGNCPLLRNCQSVDPEEC